MLEELTKELEITNKTIAATETAISERVAEFQTKLADLKSKDTELRAKIKEAMENNDVKKFENDFVAITYVAPTTRNSLDTAKFKTEQAELYQKYLKESPVSASIRIKIKENGND